MRPLTRQSAEWRAQTHRPSPAISAGANPTGRRLPSRTAQTPLRAGQLNRAAGFSNRKLRTASAPCPALSPRAQPHSRRRRVVVIGRAYGFLSAPNPNGIPSTRQGGKGPPTNATSPSSNGVRSFPRPRPGVPPGLPRCQRSPCRTPNPAGERSTRNGTSGSPNSASKTAASFPTRPSLTRSINWRSPRSASRASPGRPIASGPPSGGR